jgi:predicted Zn finger-like uncharacterized protein
MKIVCDSCGTKYSIADEKVRGKVFKIRCKKCSHIIVVRGGESAPEAAAPTADGGWHVVIDGEQVGPLSDADVRTKVERGEIKADTYTWKEGFADWVKLSAVPEFAGLVAGDEMAIAAGGELFAGSGSGAVALPNGERNGADRSRRGSGAEPSLFSGADSGDVFASPAAAAPARGNDLFASPAVDEASRWPSSGAPSAGHDGGRVENLTGQRHENSVLFSLSNLQSLAMPSAAPKPSSSLGTSATPEGSGLIDIRAMAASTLGTSNDRPGFASSGPSAPPDDLPAFGSFSPAAPVLLPLPSSSGPPKWLYAAGAVMLLALIGIGVMAWKVLSAKPPVLVETVQAVPAPAPPPAAKAAPEPAKAPSTIADDKLPPREGTPEATGAPGAKAEKAEHEHHHGGGGHHEQASAKDSKKGEKGTAVATAAAPAAPAAPVEKKPAKGSLDDLLDGAVHSRGGGGGKHVSDDDGASKKAEAAAQPLAKSAVVAGMNSVKPKISACYDQFKQQGMAMVNVVIGRNGKVSQATVTGKFAGTPTGACVEKAVKSATFPPSEGLSTPYPFQLR